MQDKTTYPKYKYGLSEFLLYWKSDGLRTAWGGWLQSIGHPLTCPRCKRPKHLDGDCPAGVCLGKSDPRCHPPECE